MEDRDFFDTLYQGWAKTTGAENMFWMPEDDEDFPGLQTIWAVDQNQERKAIASFIRSEDAAFITAIHGCFGDLVRRLHMAVDESDRLDEAADEREAKVAELAIRVMELEQENREMKEMLDEVGR